MSRVVTQGNLTPLGYEQLSGLSTAKGLPAIPKGARLARIQAEDVDVRWRDDGTDPDATTGMLLIVGDYDLYDGDLHAIKFIETAASAKVNVTYYGTPDQQQ